MKITKKSLAAIEKFWTNATFHDRVLALNTLGYASSVAKEYADMTWVVLPQEICTKLLGAAK